jgi:hypothetical protein
MIRIEDLPKVLNPENFKGSQFNTVLYNEYILKALIEKCNILSASTLVPESLIFLNTLCEESNFLESLSLLVRRNILLYIVDSETLISTVIKEILHPAVAKQWEGELDLIPSVRIKTERYEVSHS